jgi:hypothetical protein
MRVFGFEAGTITYQSFINFQALMGAVGGRLVATKNMITLKKRSQYFNYVAANRNFTNFDPLRLLLSLLRIPDYW